MKLNPRRKGDPKLDLFVKEVTEILAKKGIVIEDGNIVKGYYYGWFCEPVMMSHQVRPKTFDEGVDRAVRLLLKRFKV